MTDRISVPEEGHFQIIGTETGKLAVMAEVLAAVEQPDPGTVILDVREWPEFSGAIQAPGAARRGRVPGAVWLYWADTLNGDQTLKTTGELKQLFAAKGITPDKRVIIYCQAGVRAAHTSYVLSELIGYKQVQNYAGSWAEWSQNRELPVDSGQIAVNK
ncbi:rhodanese-like domain-containing protein [Sporomusa sp.]|uniref:sulfurtransferase n=1 Tax=Sporomusa sp. TaxID=2078658 RepID=UPI002C7A057B|nr:rhodanese-like domain-containing protein [Sporomusa sp.]HWR07651.1 rhodanese-like domain-containing protein [Sporomusa sp.]